MSLSHRAMVIGGGVSGMSAALALANMGYEVDLVEKRDRLGGILNDSEHDPSDTRTTGQAGEQSGGRLAKSPKGHHPHWSP